MGVNKSNHKLQGLKVVGKIVLPKTNREVKRAKSFQHKNFAMSQQLRTLRKAGKVA